MNTDTMRFVDRFIGSPACHLLALLTPLFVRQSSSKIIVLCKFFGLGSICLSDPLIKELKRRDYEIVYLTFHSNDPLAKIIGVERTICIAPTSLFGFAFGVIGAVFKLRKLRPVAFLNLEFFSRFAALMTLLSGAPIRAGFHISHLPVGKLYTHRTNLNVYRPIHENYLNIGMTAGVIDQLPPYDPDPTSMRLPDSNTLARSISGPYYVINAESSETVQQLRAWPAKSWAALLNQLRLLKPDIKFVLLGTKSSAELYNQILSDVQNKDHIVNMAGQTSFHEMTQLIHGAEMVVTVDSGPFHLSTLLKRRTVGLFGPETPVLYGYKLPWVRNIHKNLICSPCLALYDAKKSVLNCTDNQCLKQITVQDVIAEMDTLDATA